MRGKCNLNNFLIIIIITIIEFTYVDVYIGEEMGTVKLSESSLKRS